MPIQLTPNYVINLLWINDRLNMDKPFIKERDNQTEKETLLLPAIDFAKNNPNAPVVLWYDNQLSTPDAINRTSRLLDVLKTELNINNIELKPIQEIPLVQNNPFIFSHYTPVYFRVDLLKCIFLVEDAAAGRDYSIS